MAHREEVSAACTSTGELGSLLNMADWIICWTWYRRHSKQLIIAIIRLCYENEAHYTLYRSCLPIFGITIKSLSFLFLDEFEEHTNISVPFKSNSTVLAIVLTSTISGTRRQHRHARNGGHLHTEQVKDFVWEYRLGPSTAAAFQ